MITVKLFRIGKKNRPYYRVVVMEKRSKANGKYIDQIGFYDPLKEKNPLTIDKSKLNNWITKGVQVSEGINKLLTHYDTKIT
jgi:small subunit ribosomal protein S16